ncbi:MAG: hypothetical protein OEO23_00890 [Gemmatimonadota bacterium]|nr:hypothetical protein [Gemmatimonadota bacterium]
MGRVMLYGAVLVLQLAGCASSGESRRGSGAITAEELAAVSTSDCLEAVRTLRPQWLRSRAAPTPRDPNPTPRVVVDGNARGGLEELSLIPASDVASIDYMSASDATIRFGTGFPGGAIVVRTRRR